VTHVKPDISLLGDGDSIVTYLSNRLGWTIPAPVDAKHVTPEVKIPPSDAMWLHGEGDWSHLHMLRSKSAREAGEDDDDDDGEGREDGDNGDEDSDPDRTDSDVPEVEHGATKLHISSIDRLRASGSGSTSTPDRRSTASPASDRPTKRSRVGSMEDLPAA
jgi:hypothetical protein